MNPTPTHRTVLHARRAPRGRFSVEHGQRGSVTIEQLFIIPALFTLIFAIVQVGLYVHSGNAARHAASQAVEIARVEHGTDAQAHASAEQFLDQVSALDPHQVDITRSATEVTVTVTGSSLSLIPGWNPPVSRSASGAIERWTTP